MKNALTTTVALLVSGASALLLILFFPSEPQIVIIRIGIACAAFSSILLFLYFALRKNVSRVDLSTVSLAQKLEVTIGLLVSSSTLYVLFRYAFLLPHFWGPEIAMLGAVVCSLLVFVFCWAAPFAYVIHRRGWPPSVCSVAGLPFIVAAVPLFLRDAFWSASFPALHWYTLMAIVVGGPIIVSCQKLAFPELTSSDFFRSRRPPSIL